ncbi:hypothetical protein HMPREF9333_02269 [Johnsonella ignava ATCC 51276]|uniref:Uncharacterized protein n=1 Tax=Johnsonella ignava ATCC 51276 TaxID=679200 RepID=G5GL24_9FIRM|nr:hypothetical protein [Johnsonella ignava]EHI54580.1 hypothetical protein HMPREF9333_02269 [Johnsonella ignava ATCC 51276]
MIDIYAKEFVAIIKHLEGQGYKPYRGYFVVEKPVLQELLNHNKYEMPDSKLKTWKALNWIDTDKDRLTKRVANKAVIKLDIRVFEELKKQLKM